MAIKILVVEDNDIISKLLDEFLTKSGFKTTTAASAEEAEEILKNNKINIIINRYMQ